VPDPPPVVKVNAGGVAVLGAFNGSGSFTDSDLAGDTFTATVDYGDGSGIHPLPLTGTNFALAHNYGAAILRSFTVTVTITDDHGAWGVGKTTVTVAL
jgi:hypothetical protein